MDRPGFGEDRAKSGREVRGPHHARVITPVREGMKPLCELVTPIPFVALQQMLNESSRWGTLAYEKALYLDSLSDAAIAVIGEHAPKKKSPLSFLPTFRLDGKYLARSDADSAFGGSRSGGYVLNIAAHAPPGAPRDRTKPTGPGCGASGTRCDRTRPARAAMSIS